MTAYADRTHLAKWGASADRLAIVATDIQDAALEATARVMDGYIARRKTLPLLSWGDDWRRANCILAARDIMEAQVGVDPDRPGDDVWARRAVNVTIWLEGIRDGATEFVCVDSTPTNTEGDPEVFTDTARGW